MKTLAYLVYIPLQLVWLPFSVLGGIWVAYKQIWVSRQKGLSQTAIEIINGRWTLDWFGLRTDDPSRRLIRHLPNTSVFGLKLTLFPLWLSHKLTGQRILYPILPAPAQAKLANMVASRSDIFDRYIDDRLTRAKQFLVLGGGLDTRCYGPIRAHDLALFELDRAPMQAFKRVRLDAAGISHAHVQFAAADFSDTDWMAALDASDYDPAAPTVFLLEGVTLYLSEEELQALFATVRRRAGPGSVIILDLYANYFIRLGQRGSFNKSLEMTGEHLQFGLDFSGDAEAELLRFSDTNNLTCHAHTFLGSDSKKGPFMVVATFGV